MEEDLLRYFLEPSGTTCSIDYWHSNFRNYYVHVSVLTVLGFLVPIAIRQSTLLKQNTA